MPAAAHGARSGTARRRRPAEHHGEEGGSERWLVTYADMLTLLLVLFIVLFSISVVNTSKYISLKTSLGAVFGDGQSGVLPGGNGVNDNELTGSGQQLVMDGMPVSGSASSNNDKTAAADLQKTAAAAAAETEQDHFKAVQKSVTAALKKADLAGAVRFTTNARGLTITVVTNALVFPGNSADLLGRGQQILATIAPALAKDTHSIEVDGNTNQQNVSTYPYPSGWELSSARASAVVRYLVGHDVSASRLTAVGYSDQHPLYPASDPRSVTLNRRVDIVVLANASIAAAQSSSTGTAAISNPVGKPVTNPVTGDGSATGNPVTSAGSTGSN
jgi:chemotaxis protein MotB